MSKPHEDFFFFKLCVHLNRTVWPVKYILIHTIYVLSLLLSYFHELSLYTFLQNLHIVLLKNTYLLTVNCISSKDKLVSKAEVLNIDKSVSYVNRMWAWKYSKKETIGGNTIFHIPM